MTLSVQSDKNPSLTLLFLSFFRLGLTSFGGPAIVAYIRKLVVVQKKWLQEVTFHQGLALCQSLPGSTGPLTAGYVGLNLGGLSGAILCYVAFILPAFILMMILSFLYLSFHSSPPIVSAFNGLQAIIVAIVANAAISFGLVSVKRYSDIIITIVAAIAFLAKLHPILVIVIAALLGLLLHKTEGLSVIKENPPGKLYSTRHLIFLFVAAAAAYVILFLVNPQLFDIGAILSRISIFCFGSGFSAIPLMYHEVVEVRAWMDSNTLMDGIALGQITPGPVAITSTFIGYILQGPVGAVIATIGMFLPPFFIMVLIVPYYQRLRSSVYFNRIVAGIICSFVGLLLSVTLRFAFDVPWEPIRIALAAASLLALLFKVDILYVVLTGTVIAIFVL
jgi:chromate transporter